ncbi:neurogenic differentiation factor 1-like [Procambarus clarkii]|uniref:neurogenic differentiation factor 1-like n=1 Tax=Procambarus clarkii TaxID=6728 RepID=UPI001E6773C2|nr:neurogenic differentiation factor 1-like [Procambarus clarkii]
MAKSDNVVRARDQMGVSVDNNNNSSNKYSGNAKGIAVTKYQLRPRSEKSRRHCYDSDWSFQDTLRHKPRPPPLSRYRRKTANARERYRMRQINTAFDSLRGVLPSWVCSRRASTDLTKITTLKLASAYIRSLQDILDGNAQEDTYSWILSSILGDAPSPQQPQPVHHYSPTTSPSKTQQQQQQQQLAPAHATTDAELVSFLCSASNHDFHESLESFSYLSPAPDTDTVSLLLLGADPPRCWGETQLTLPVS